MQKGDVAHVLADLMPAQLSSISAAGKVKKAKVTITALACEDPTQSLYPDGQSGQAVPSGWPSIRARTVPSQGR